MEPQEQPTKAIFSFADELQRRQQRAEEQKAVWEQNSNGPQNYTAAAKIRFSPTSRR